MTKPIQDLEPKFIKNATSVQKWLASIAASMIITVIFTGFDFCTKYFEKNKFLDELTFLRMSIALCAVLITSIVGFLQIKGMVAWALDAWSMYKEIKNKIEKDHNREKDN